MELSYSTSMRMEQRQLLTPRMIQSMEILQLPLMALETRIEQELQSNPVLELEEPAGDEPPVADADPLPSPREENQRLEITDGGEAEFARLDRIADYLENEEYGRDAGFSKGSRVRDDGEPDKKLEALANTAGRGIGLTEYLTGQWTFVEAEPGVREAGLAIIAAIGQDGYLRTDLETLKQNHPKPITIKELETALPLVQQLEPAGVGARSLGECWLIQLNALEHDPELAEGHDLELERKLVRHHLRDLELNRYPQLAAKIGRSIEQIRAAVQGLGRLNAHPGRLIGSEQAPPVIPDAVIRLDEATGQYVIEMSREKLPRLSISEMYRKMARDRAVDRGTRDYLATNVRNAKWLLDSITQRESTIQRVIREVVQTQKEFFEKGPEYLKPLPMTLVAERLGFHVATVSRAVSEKWIQTPRGVLPLRRFFSQGTTSADGTDMSWDAVKEKLRQIVDAEDKRNPLNDEELVKRLGDQGLKLARRTVAKYRDILDIPVARQRKQF